MWCQGVNGGGWAHYVGQEKCRPIEGWNTVAFAKDWQDHHVCKMVQVGSILRLINGNMRNLMLIN